MLTRKNMKGLYVLVVTPMDDQLRVDYDGHRENVHKLIDLGVDGIVLNGTNGEFHTCTDEERQRLTKILVEEGKGKVMCIAGCSSVNTSDAIRRTKQAVDLGADGVLNVVPYYQPPTKSECIAYLKELATACSDIGIILYNMPSTTQVLFSDDDFLQLEDTPNFVGSKMNGANLRDYLNCIRRTTTRHFPIEPLWGISNAAGGVGVLASYLYTSPKYMMRWWHTIESGDVAASMQMQHEVNHYFQEVVQLPFRQGASGAAGTKAIIQALGHWKCGGVRKPYFDVPRKVIENQRRLTEERFPQFLE